MRGMSHADNRATVARSIGLANRSRTNTSNARPRKIHSRMISMVGTGNEDIRPFSSIAGADSDKAQGNVA